jgi:hypothetical protein
MSVTASPDQGKERKLELGLGIDVVVQHGKRGAHGISRREPRN